MKRKVPYHKLFDIIEKFYLVSFNEKVSQESMIGPTSDFEDNVQLNSAKEADCDFFLTNDGKLIKMKFFGKVRIVERL